MAGRPHPSPYFCAPVFTLSNVKYILLVCLVNQADHNIIASINKKDMDYSLALFELTPKGEYFELTYFFGRTSYAHDLTKRTLLQPGEITSAPFDRTKIVSRQLRKGSRLLIELSLSKNNFCQVSYGTGKDVSDESIADAKEPLKVKWYSSSYVEIPVSK